MDFLKKRGQITIFIVLGLVVIVVFAFLLRVSSEVQKSKLETKAEEIVVELENTQSIQHYIELCIKQSGETALLKMGEQGGRVWKETQNGSSSLDDTPHIPVNINGTITDMSYGVVARDLNPPHTDSEFYNAPWYPEETKNLTFLNYSKNYMAIGIRTMPYLCDNSPESLNRWDNPPNVLSRWSCAMRADDYWSVSPETFQIQLANYTSLLVAECIDSAYIKNKTGYDVLAKTPNITVIMGEDDVAFETKLPIEVVFNAKKALTKSTHISKSMDFSVTIPVRAKRVFDFFYEITENERKSLTYDFYEDYPKSSSFKWLNQSTGRIEVTKGRLSVDGPEDVIRLIDYDSQLFGGPFVFSSVIMNRNPALDWIHQTSPGQKEIDIYAMEGDTITISPIGVDPDEDYYKTLRHPDHNFRIMEKQYNYAGWMETEYHYFNYTCCLGLGLDAEKCFWPVPNGCVVRDITIKPHNWTNSPEYKTTGRVATYKTTRADIGTHELNVSVCDEHGLCDWQTVRIRVDASPIAVAAGFNNYSDFDEHYASIEDPYWLNANMSRSLMGHVLTGPFFWNDNAEGWTQSFMLPLVEVPWNNYNILNISHPRGLETSGNNLNFWKTGTGTALLHKLTLTIQTPSATTSDTWDVNVYKCLPHVDYINNAAPWPLNDKGFKDDPDVNKRYNAYGNNDEWQATHSCCVNNSGRFEYAENNVNCYDFTSYAPFWGFDNSIFIIQKTEYQSTGTQSPFTNYPVSWGYVSRDDTTGSVVLDPSIRTINDAVSILSKLLPLGNFYDYSLSDGKYYSYNNDIYTREFTTKCGGNRGNICDNNPAETRTSADGICSDTLSFPDQTEKCSGPPPEAFKAGFVESAAKLQCVNYWPGDSFDKNLRGTWDYDYVCSGGSCWSIDGFVANNVGGITWNQDRTDGQCDETYQCVLGSDYEPLRDDYDPNTALNYLSKGVCDGEGGCTGAEGVPNGVPLAERDYYNDNDLYYSPGTYYWYDKDGDDPGLETWMADTSIDCRCWARSARIGSFGIDARYDTYSVYAELSDEERSKYCIEPYQLCSYQRNEYGIFVWTRGGSRSVIDNEADAMNYTDPTITDVDIYKDEAGPGMGDLPPIAEPEDAEAYAIFTSYFEDVDPDHDIEEYRLRQKDPEYSESAYPNTVMPPNRNLGKCVSGAEYNCEPDDWYSLVQDKCALNPELSYKVYANYFYNCELSSTGNNWGDNCRLKQYLPSNSDGVCNTFEGCTVQKSIDPDKDEAACKLLRWAKNGYDEGEKGIVTNPDGLTSDTFWYQERYEIDSQSYSKYRWCCRDDEGEKEDYTQSQLNEPFQTNPPGGDLDVKGCRKSNECVVNAFSSLGENIFAAMPSNKNTLSFYWRYGDEPEDYFSDMQYPDIDVDGYYSEIDYCYWDGTNDAIWTDCSGQAGRAAQGYQPNTKWESDEFCKYDEWCVTTDPVDQQNGRITRDCAPKLDDGQECSRDWQCDSNSYCKPTFVDQNKKVCARWDKCPYDVNNLEPYYNNNRFCIFQDADERNFKQCVYDTTGRYGYTWETYSCDYSPFYLNQCHSSQNCVQNFKCIYDQFQPTNPGYCGYSGCDENCDEYVCNRFSTPPDCRESCRYDSDCVTPVCAGEPNGVCTYGVEGDRCYTIDDCRNSLYCYTNNHICYDGDYGDFCSGTCASEFYCQNSRCRDGRDGDPCSTATQCQSGFCGRGVCSDGQPGDPCDSGDDCASETCNIIWCG